MNDGYIESFGNLPERRSVMAVLIVDDNLNSLQVLQFALHKKGIKSTCCSDQTQALRFAVDKKYDMIVCDYFMPQIDGRSLLQRIRQFRPDCRLVLTSSYPLGIHCIVDDEIRFIDKCELVEFILEGMSTGWPTDEVTY